MAWKAALADGTVPGTAFVSPGEADRAARAAAKVMSWLPAGRSDPALDLRLALLHAAAGLDRSEVARLAGVGRTRVSDALTRHASRLESDPAYDELVSRVLRSAVSRSLPAPTRAFDLPMRVAKGAASRSSSTRSGDRRHRRRERDDWCLARYVLLCPR